MTNYILGDTLIKAAMIGVLVIFGLGNAVVLYQHIKAGYYVFALFHVMIFVPWGLVTALWVLG